MTTVREDRDLMAFVLSVPLSVLLWAMLTFLRLAVIDGIGAAVRDVPTLVIGGLTLGLLTAMMAVALLAGPLYAALMAVNRIGPVVALAAGTLVGIVTAVVWTAFVGEGVLLPAWMGALVGAITAALWWGIARGVQGGER